MVQAHNTSILSYLQVEKLQNLNLYSILLVLQIKLFSYC